MIGAVAECPVQAGDADGAAPANLLGLRGLRHRWAQDSDREEQLRVFAYAAGPASPVRRRGHATPAGTPTGPVAESLDRMTRLVAGRRWRRRSSLASWVGVDSHVGQRGADPFTDEGRGSFVADVGDLATALLKQMCTAA